MFHFGVLSASLCAIVMPQKPPRNHKATQRKMTEKTVEEYTDVHTAQFLIILKMKFLFHDCKS